MSGIAAVLVVLYVLYMSYRDAYVRFPKNTRNAVVSGEIGKPLFPAKTPVRAKNDGLTPVALRAKRPLIAPSRPSPSRLGERRRGVGRSPFPKTKLPNLQASKLPHLLLGAGKWGAGGRTTVRPALAPQLSCKRCVFAVFCENAEAQGMGTLVRPGGANGEVPRPLRTFVFSWKWSLTCGAWRGGARRIRRGRGRPFP